MGIKESVERLTQGRAEEERRIREEEARQRQAREEQRRAQFDKELPEVTRQRRLLLQDLRAIGVIGMIEDMIKPDKIAPILTEKQKAANRKKSQRGLTAKQLAALPPLLGLNASRPRQEWAGKLLQPHQEDDGAVNPTLVFSISTPEQYTYPVPQKISQVTVTYTRDRILTVKGQDVTFESRVTRKKHDIDEIELGLAKAFVYPEIPVNQSTQSPHNNLPPVYKA